MLTDFISQKNQENDRKDSEQDFITELLDPEGILRISNFKIQVFFCDSLILSPRLIAIP